jgi:hypothetical protein
MKVAVFVHADILSGDKALAANEVSELSGTPLLDHETNASIKPDS